MIFVPMRAFFPGFTRVSQTLFSFRFRKKNLDQRPCAFPRSVKTRRNDFRVIDDKAVSFVKGNQ